MLLFIVSVGQLLMGCAMATKWPATYTILALFGWWTFIFCMHTEARFATSSLSHYLHRLINYFALQITFCNGVYL